MKFYKKNEVIICPFHSISNKCISNKSCYVNKSYYISFDFRLLFNCKLITIEYFVYDYSHDMRSYDMRCGKSDFVVLKRLVTTDSKRDDQTSPNLKSLKDAKKYIAEDLRIFFNDRYDKTLSLKNN